MKRLLTPKLDLVFKLLFTKDMEILIDLINSVQAPHDHRHIRSAEVLNPGIYPETIPRKLIILDVRARDESGRQYDIEMQARKYDTYPQRALYYMSRMVADQLSAGDDYGELNPVIGIHFLDYEQFPDCEDFHFHFELRDERHSHLRLTEDLCIHLFELPKFEKHLAGSEAESDLTQWLHFFNHAHEQGEENMIAQYTNPKIRKALAALEALSADENIRLLAEEREKALKDEASALASARREGERIGREEGEKLGREEGERIGRRKNAKSLLRMRVLTVEQIAQATELSLDEVEALKEE